LAGSYSDHLRAEYFRTLARSMQLASELERMLLAFGDAGLPVMLLKGAALVPDWYQDPGLRPMCDLDLLLAEDALPTADAILRELGYEEPGSLSTRERRVPAGHHHWPPLLDSGGVVAVELHHHLGPRDRFLGFELDGMWSRARPAVRGAAPCVVPSPEDQVIHTSLHFLGHHLARTYGALGQLRDIAVVVSGAGAGESLDWDLVLREGARHDVTGSLALVLSVVAELFGIHMPREVLAPVRRPGRRSPAADELISRRVFRSDCWSTLERLSARRRVLRQLLPPHPSTIWAKGAHRDQGDEGDGQNGRKRAGRPFVSWAMAAGRAAVHPAELRHEHSLERALRRLVMTSTPQTPPDVRAPVL
jgi:hypothetical protein